MKHFARWAAPQCRATFISKLGGQPLGEAILLRSPGIDLDEFWRLMPAVHEAFIKSGRVDVVTEGSITAIDALITAGKKVMILTSRTKTEVKH